MSETATGPAVASVHRKEIVLNNGTGTADVPGPPGGLVPGDTYHVRVRSACTPQDTDLLHWSAWSPAKAFAIKSPEMLKTSVTTAVSTYFFTEADTGGNLIPANQNNATNEGRGAATLSWKATPLASSYQIYLHDGNIFRQVGSTTGTSWTTAGKGLFPLDSGIGALPAGYTYLVNPYASPYALTELRDDPRPLYAKAAADTMHDRTDYLFKVVPVSSLAGAPAISECATVSVTLANRTHRVNGDPRHTTYDIGDAGLLGHSAEVLLDKGAVRLSATDLEIDWWGPRATLERHYSSDRTTAGSWAQGWRFNFEQSLTLNPAGNVATYTDAAGEAHRFGNSGGTWVSAHGFYGTLTKLVDWQITYKDGSKLVFDGVTGRLKSESDANGNTVLYTLVGNNVQIAAVGNGHVITVNRTSAGVVTGATYATTAGTRTITYAAGVSPTVTYYYGVGDSANRTLSLGYTGNRLTSLSHAVSGISIGFDYDVGGAVMRAELPGYGADIYRQVGFGYMGGAGAVASYYGRVGNANNTYITHTFSLNANGTCLYEATASGMRRYTYSPTLEVVQETSPLGHVTRKSVDGFGLVRDEYDADKGHTSYEYNAKGLCTRETDPRGAVTTRDYDASGNLISDSSVLDKSGTVSLTTYAYGHASYPGVVTSEVRSLNATESAMTLYSGFGTTGRPLATIQYARLSPTAPSAAAIYTYRVPDAFGNVTDEYLPSTSNLPGAATTSAYSVSGRLISSTDPFGVVTWYSYDELGRETEVYSMHPSAALGRQVGLTRWTYGANGRPDTETKYLKESAAAAMVASTATYTYDALGRTVFAADSCTSGQLARTDYDAAGNVTESWPAGVPAYDAARAHRSTYDADGRVISSLGSGEATPSITSYTPGGRVATNAESGGKTTTYTYDAAGNTTAEVSSAGTGTACTSYAYDLGGRMIRSMVPGGVETTYTYDIAGRQVSAGGSGQAASVTCYNELGWPLREVDADGVVTARSYDALGDAVFVTVDGKTTSNTYGKGRLGRIEDPDGREIEYQYDLFGNVHSEHHFDYQGSPSAAYVKSTSREHDSLGRLLTENYYRGVFGVPVQTYESFYSYPQNTPGVSTRTDSYGDVTTTVVIDSNDLETTRQTTSPGITAFTRTVSARDAGDRETAVTLTSGVNTASLNAEYDGSGRLERQWGSGIATTKPVNRSYAYNDAGKKSSEQLFATYGGSIETTFGYNLNERLTSARTSVGTTFYEYDDSGNIKRAANTSGVTTLNYNPANNRLSSFMPAGSVTPLMVGYDGSGQRITQGPASNLYQTRFSYLKTGRLGSFAASATPGASAPSATYTYDALGQRRKSVINDTTGKTTTADWTYDDLQLLCYSASRSDNATWCVTYLYDGAGCPYAGTYTDSSGNKVPFYMVTSDRGDVVSLLASNGSAFAAYRYDQWGNPTATSTQAATSISAPLAALIAERQVLRYAGYVWDAESKTYYCSARNYDPTTMQFLSKDPAKSNGEESAFQYCGGDPANNYDPTGNWTVRYKVKNFNVNKLNKNQRATYNLEYRLKSWTYISSWKDKRSVIYSYLRNTMGVTREQACAILGNISVETGGRFSSLTLEKNLRTDAPAYIRNYSAKDGKGWGILQWTYAPRKAALMKHANAYAMKKTYIWFDVGDMAVQLDYFNWERKNLCKSEWARFNKTTGNIEALTKAFCKEYENPRNPNASMKDRVSAANACAVAYPAGRR
ncbi:MAG: phage tail tip lysozyme [Coriobacteriia bacterium]|nr:phage tail tip lysozyme [Coriobacteriia bacterium]